MSAPTQGGDRGGICARAKQEDPPVVSTGDPVSSRRDLPLRASSVQSLLLVQHTQRGLQESGLDPQPRSCRVSYTAALSTELRGLGGRVAQQAAEMSAVSFPENALL